MITNAVILDHWGIVKADIGIKNGRIVKVGKAGNPDTMKGVDPELVVGAGTEVISGENLIVTAGGVDSHIHFISPQQVYEGPVENGITTMIGGGTRPPRAPRRRPARLGLGIWRGCCRPRKPGR